MTCFECSRFSGNFRIPRTLKFVILKSYIRRILILISLDECFHFQCVCVCVCVCVCACVSECVSVNMCVSVCLYLCIYVFISPSIRIQLNVSLKFLIVKVIAYKHTYNTRYARNMYHKGYIPKITRFLFSLGSP